MSLSFKKGLRNFRARSFVNWRCVFRRTAKWLFGGEVDSLPDPFVQLMRLKAERPKWVAHRCCCCCCCRFCHCRCAHVHVRPPPTPKHGYPPVDKPCASCVWGDRILDADTRPWFSVRRVRDTFLECSWSFQWPAMGYRNCEKGSCTWNKVGENDSVCARDLTAGDSVLERLPAENQRKTLLRVHCSFKFKLFCLFRDLLVSHKTPWLWRLLGWPSISMGEQASLVSLEFKLALLSPNEMFEFYCV